MCQETVSRRTSSCPVFDIGLGHRSALPEDIHHYIILDELVPVKAFATKVECLPGKKSKCVRTNFNLCRLHHNHLVSGKKTHLSLGSKLLFRASVFLLLQLH